MTNYLILNLRSQAQAEEATTLSTKTDMFFRSAYGQSPGRNETRTIMDTILGNIGEPLRVDDENDEDNGEDNGEGSTEIRELPPPEDCINGGEEQQQEEEV